MHAICGGRALTSWAPIAWDFLILVVSGFSGLPQVPAWCRVYLPLALPLSKLLSGFYCLLLITRSWGQDAQFTFLFAATYISHSLYRTL